jgi:tetratricopeptide (TPR) repeat protein
MKPLFLLVLLLLPPAARAESFNAWAARGAREEREKDDKTAFQSYSNALTEWKPTDGGAGKAKVLCARAALRDRSGDEAGALADYSDCVALDKKNAKALDRRGELRLKSGKISPAIDDFYKAIALDIRFAAAYADRARAYELQGDRGFAGEDYRRACGLGVKAACAKAGEFAPPRKTAKKPKKAAPAAAEPDSTPPAPAAPKAAAAKRAAYKSRFADCIDALQDCSDEGNSFGSCVDRAPSCERKTVKGCCPGACRAAYRKALDSGASEAAAYRDIFAPKASCAH